MHETSRQPNVLRRLAQATRKTLLRNERCAVGSGRLIALGYSNNKISGTRIDLFTVCMYVCMYVMYVMYVCM